MDDLRWIRSRLIRWLGAASVLAVSISAQAIEQNPPEIRLSGFLRSQMSESIRPPATEEWSFNIMMLAPEGSRVEAGAVVARLEGELLKQRLSEASNRLLQAKIKREQKISDLKTQIDDLRKQLSDDKTELQLLETSYQAAQKDAQWTKPARDLLADKLDIEAKQIQLALKRDKLERKVQLLTVVDAAMAKNVTGSELRIASIQAALAQGERKTNNGGIVVYKRTMRERQKVRVGASVHRGTEVLAIVDDKNLFVEGFLREEDWRWVKPGMPAKIKILGRRELSVDGEIEQISAIVMKAGDWDRTLNQAHPLFGRRVFRVVIKLLETPEAAKPEGEVEVEIPRGEGK